MLGCMVLGSGHLGGGHGVLVPLWLISNQESVIHTLLSITSIRDLIPINTCYFESLAITHNIRRRLLQ
jgi:hypothetical protein